MTLKDPPDRRRQFVTVLLEETNDERLRPRPASFRYLLKLRFAVNRVVSLGELVKVLVTTRAELGFKRLKSFFCLV